MRPLAYRPGGQAVAADQADGHLEGSAPPRCRPAASTKPSLALDGLAGRGVDGLLDLERTPKHAFHDTCSSGEGKPGRALTVEASEVPAAHIRRYHLLAFAEIEHPLREGVSAMSTRAPSDANQPRVAIACQGGGSHTAFTAGVLKRLFQPSELASYQVVALSGTSGGAVCALLAWSALLADDPASAGRLLDEFWADNSASAPHERLLNAWGLWASTVQQFVVTPAISPYDTGPFATAALDEFKRMLQRRVDFDRLEVQTDDTKPMLLVGAVDVLSGEFRAFNSRRERISVDTILASAAIPNLFRAVHLNGGTYWDGLFSQNPPIRELIDARPDEIWVIQINPKELETEPTTALEIADRRNELAGNLSLHQELHFIEKVDQMLEAGVLPRDGKYKNIMVRVVELSRSRVSRSLGTASKLNRDPEFIRDLISHGEDRAEEFLTALAFERAWRNRDTEAVMSFLADDVEFVSSSPFPDEDHYRGADHIRPFVRHHLTTDIDMDATRKQVARNRVAWTVRAQRDVPAVPLRGRVEAELLSGKITSLRLGPAPAE
jgi:NTE family protein